MFGYEKIGEFTHLLENILVCVRSGKLDMNGDLTVIFLECHDFIMNMIDFFEDNNNQKLDEMNEKIFNEIAGRLNSYIEMHDCIPVAEREEYVQEITSCVDD